LGDWVPVKSVTPKEFTSSVYYYTDVTILAKAAALFGRQNDFEKYTALAEKIKNAINQKYLNPETGIYGSGLQTELSVALYWGIVPDSLKSNVAKNLANRVIQDNKHIDVGLLGTKAILNALSENGYAELAAEVALQETYPSWGWWIKNGATTLVRKLEYRIRPRFVDEPHYVWRNRRLVLQGNWRHFPRCRKSGIQKYNPETKLYFFSRPFRSQP
jgi:alpha-L-rhamnosidase